MSKYHKEFLSGGFYVKQEGSSHWLGHYCSKDDVVRIRIPSDLYEAILTKAKRSWPTKKSEPSPCPCCGNRKIYTGHLYSCTMGVECMPAMGGCGLSIRRNYPDTMPKGIKGLKELDAHLIKKAIEAWNRREA